MYGKKKTTARFTRLGLLPRKWFEKKNPHYFWFYRKKKTSVPREKKSRKCITRRVLESFLAGNGLCSQKKKTLTHAHIQFEFFIRYVVDETY